MSQNIVSVVVPYYKNKKFIKKAIDSIMNQSYKNFEILLIYDDPSKSDLSYIKNNFTNKKIKLIINKENQGAAKSRNIAMKKSKGKFIAFLDSDDFWKKDKLKKQLEFMRTHSLDFSYTAYNILNKKKFLRKEVPIQIEYKDLLKRCDIGLSTVVIKKKILKKFKFAKLKTKEDYVLWLQLAKNGNTFYGLNQNLSLWRLSKNSLSSSIIRKLIDGYKVYRLYLNQGAVKSFLSVMNLSINYLKKNA